MKIFKISSNILNVYCYYVDAQPDLLYCSGGLVGWASIPKKRGLFLLAFESLGEWALAKCS